MGRSTQLALILPRLAKCRLKVGFEKLRIYMGADWRRSSAHGAKASIVREAFSPSREKHFLNSHSFGGSASEARAITPLFAYMLQTVPGLRDEIPRETESFLALANLVRIITSTSEGASCVGVREAMTDHSQKKAIAYGVGTGIFKYKSHAKFHIAEQFAAGVRVDALVCERLHIAAKRRLEDVRNTTSFERTAMERAIVEAVHKWDEADTQQHGLVDAQQTGDGTIVARRCRWRGLPLAAGDVVRQGDLHLYEVFGACKLPGDDRLFFGGNSLFIRGGARSQCCALAANVGI